ncbi:uncharacterized protein LOC134842199 [Symsagittifera roscoffensis]|uniref:uncharacterized protein LOC134842199 n=1 Tax=Symsagittifera roscoffensis TaxID=84072 RepID=UPI00307B7A56
MPSDSQQTVEIHQIAEHLPSEPNSEEREDWLLVDKNQHQNKSARDDKTTTTGKSEKLNSRERKTSASRTTLDPSLVFEIKSETQFEASTSSAEMSTNEEKEEAALQSTYDAIEDSLYKEIDRDTSTGSGKRGVHLGNYRMKEKSEKVTVKDANVSKPQHTTQTTGTTTSSSNS